MVQGDAWRMRRKLGCHRGVHRDDALALLNVMANYDILKRYKECKLIIASHLQVMNLSMSCLKCYQIGARA